MQYNEAITAIEAERKHYMKKKSAETQSRLRRMTSAFAIIASIWAMMIVTANITGYYLPDSTTTALAIATVLLFLGYGLYSALSNAKPRGSYDNASANKTIRRLVGDVEEIRALDDTQLNVFFDHMHEYFAAQKGRYKSLDFTGYVEFVSNFGLRVDPPTAELLLRAQEIYVNYEI